MDTLFALGRATAWTGTAVGATALGSLLSVLPIFGWVWTAQSWSGLANGWGDPSWAMYCTVLTVFATVIVGALFAAAAAGGVGAVAELVAAATGLAGGRDARPPRAAPIATRRRADLAARLQARDASLARRERILARARADGDDPVLGRAASAIAGFRADVRAATCRLIAAEVVCDADPRGDVVDALAFADATLEIG